MSDPARFAVVLVRPDSHENIGLAARGMANAGFGDLRLVGLDRLEAPAWRTAIHAESIIERARFYPSLAEAVADRELVLGSTARVRHDFPLVPLDGAVARLAEYPETVRVGLVFGNERTGLTQGELGLANLRFHIPQAGRQPSYNLGVAVTLTLHAIAFRPGPPPALRRHPPLDHAAQAEAGRRFREMLERLGFMHDTNREFIAEKVEDIFFRMALTAKDRDVILALFRRALEGPRQHRPGRPREAAGPGKERS
ncbi:MAG TPA: RNA methyltransferase [Candidatus Aminicenantes bacterium]|nr:RNA methyltransferase [Candidatus Aminicenantes bacterium]HRY64661.1 RNA methyltransferase [Candidatus Aminicenantes bacterium]HRZ71574.1 RNA methyltransferase [Candidatus Aminicenantes bacterium]